jgi:hypothetical protein
LGRIWGEARKAGGGGFSLRRLGILDADQGQGMAAQCLPRRDKFLFVGELRGPSQVEHDRSVEKK